MIGVKTSGRIEFVTLKCASCSCISWDIGILFGKAVDHPQKIVQINCLSGFSDAYLHACNCASTTIVSFKQNLAAAGISTYMHS